MEALAATTQEDRNTELELELLDATGQTGLRDVAALCGAAEMLFFGDGDEVFELSQKHRCLASPRVRVGNQPPCV